MSVSILVLLHLDLNSKFSHFSSVYLLQEKVAEDVGNRQRSRQSDDTSPYDDGLVRCFSIYRVHSRDDHSLPENVDEEDCSS